MRQASTYHQMKENYNCEDCHLYIMEGLCLEDRPATECLKCGFQLVSIAGFMSLDLLNEQRVNYNSYHGYDEGDDEYLPELTLEEYKLIAKKHHNENTTGGYHPNLYGLWTTRAEPNWDGSQDW